MQKGTFQQFQSHYKNLSNQNLQDSQSKKTPYQQLKQEYISNNDLGYLANILNQKEQLLLKQIKKRELKKQSVKNQTEKKYQKEIEKLKKSLYSSRRTNNQPDRLYKHAIMKAQTQIMMQKAVKKNAEKLSSSQKMSKGSYKIMMKKIDEDLSYIFSQIDPKSSNFISFQKLGRVLTLLQIFRCLKYNQNVHFFYEFFLEKNQEEQTEIIIKRKILQMNLLESLWGIVTGYINVQTALCQMVYNILKILLDPHNQKCKTQTIMNYLLSYWQNNENFKGVNLQQVIIEQNIINFVKLWKQLHNTRLSYQKTGYLKKQRYQQIIKDHDNICTFRPKILEKSAKIQLYHTSNFIQEMMNQYSKNHGQHSSQQDEPQKIYIPTRTDILYQKKKKVQQKIMKEQRLKQLKEIQNCTFKPDLKQTDQINNIVSKNKPQLIKRLYKYESREQKQKKQILAKQARELKQIQQCTFTPAISFKTSHSSKLLSSQQNNINQFLDKPNQENKIPGYDKAVGRLRYGNHINNIKKLQLQHIPTGQGYQFNKKNPKPPSFLNRPKIKKQQPFVYIDVNMGNGKLGRIGLHKGDCAQVVAKNFAKTFSLNQAMQKQIQLIVQQQLSNNNQ